MKHVVSLPLWIALVALAGNLVCSAEPSFDYFKNSWAVVGLKDYGDGTRIRGYEIEVACETTENADSRRATARDRDENRMAGVAAIPIEL